MNLGAPGDSGNADNRLPDNTRNTLISGALPPLSDSLMALHQPGLLRNLVLRGAAGVEVCRARANKKYDNNVFIASGFVA